MKNKPCYFLIGMIILILSNQLASEGVNFTNSQPKIGLIFDQELKNYREVLYFPIVSYPEFKIGQAIEESLTQAILNSYPKTEKIDTEPQAESPYDYVVRISLNWPKCGLKSVAPISSYSSPEFDKKYEQSHFLRFVLSFSVEILDGKSMTLINKKDLEKSTIYVRREDSTSEQPTAKGIEYETKKFEKVIDKTIEEITKETIKWLKTNLAQSV